MGSLLSCCWKSDRVIDVNEGTQNQLRVPVIWILGSPGSGVEDQVKRIRHRYKLHNLSPAHLIKIEMEKQTPLGKRIALNVLQDDLITLPELMSLLNEEIREHRHTTNGFYMEQFPLTISQGLAFEECVCEPAVMFHLDCPLATIKNRLSGGRPDDKKLEIKITRKLIRFHSRTNPVIQYYDKRLTHIDSDREPDVVFLQVSEILDRLFQNPLYLHAMPFNYSKFDEDDEPPPRRRHYY